MIPLLVSLIIAAAGIPSHLEEAAEAMKRGDYEAAVGYYNLELENEPSSYDARYGLARALSFSEHRREAIQVYSELIAEHPDDPDLRLGRGRTYAWEKQYPEAQADLEWITERFPDYADAWSALGDVFRWSDRPNEAVTVYTRWIALRPDDPAPYLARAQANRELNQYEETKNDLKKAETLGGDPAKIAEILADLEQTRIYPWQFGVTYDYLNFSPSVTDWHTVKSMLRRTFEHGSLALESIQTERFSEWDDALAVDGYLDLWPRAYANLRFQVTNDAGVLPRLDYASELYQGFGEGWELSGGYRHMDYSSNNVDLYSVSLGKYIGDWYLREKTYFLPESDGIDLSQSFSIRRYLANEDDYIQFETGFGNESVTLGLGPVIESRRTHFFSLGVHKFLTNRLGIVVSLTYQDIDRTPIRRGINFGFITRW